MRKKAVAVKSREGYFYPGDEIEVVKISSSVYRVYGKDPRGYEFTCLTVASKIKVLA
jgi:hypothetical protein